MAKSSNRPKNNEPEIGNVDEGVVKRGENTGDAKDKGAYIGIRRLAKW
jgi:hypothetical protein